MAAGAIGIVGQACAEEKGYSGLGQKSVSQAVVERFAPPPLPSEVSRRLQALLDLRAPQLGRLLPDGKRYCFDWTVTGTSQVFCIEGPNTFPVQRTGGEDVTHLVDITPDGKWLVLSRDRKGEENPGLYLQAIDHRGNGAGGPLVAVQHKPGVQTLFQFTSDDSRYIYYRSNDRRPDAYAIYRYEIGSQKTELLFSEEGLWSLRDHLPDGRMLLVRSVGELAEEFYEWSPGAQKRPLFGVGEREEFDAMFTGRRSGELVVLTPKFDEFHRLYRFVDGKFTPISPEQKRDLFGLQVDPSRRRILYQENDRGYTRLAALDARTFKPVVLPKWPTVDHVIAGVTSRDGRYTPIGIGTSQAPMTTDLFDWQTKRLVRYVQSSTPEIDTSRFSVAELTSYPARDGTPIPAFVRRPASCAAGPCPVIILFHGGPEGQSLPGFNVRSQLFVDAGFVFVEPNVRGSLGYGRTWLHADDGPKRLSVITDIADAATWARQTFAKDGRAPRVGILGGSYGGYSSLIGMSMFAGAYDAGVAVVGISDLRSFLRNTAPYRRALRISEYGDPVRDEEALKRLSPITYLEQVKAPLLLIQGVSDPRVPVGEALQMYEALDRRKVPVKLILFADEGHGAQKRENKVLELGHTLDFFEKQLGPKPLATSDGTSRK